MVNMPDETIEKIDKRKGKGKYWYFIRYRECVEGDSSYEERERRYTPKPDDWTMRHEYSQYFCGNHY
jgi:hypothetical protein